MLKLHVVRGPVVVLLLVATSAVCVTMLALPATASSPTWSETPSVDPFEGLPVAVSCPTAGFCAVVDQGSAFTYSGGTWSTSSSSLGSLVSVSCPSASYCTALEGSNVGNVFTTWRQPPTWCSPSSPAAARPAAPGPASPR